MKIQDQLKKIKKAYTTVLTMRVLEAYLYNLDILIRITIKERNKAAVNKFLQLKKDIAEYPEFSPEDLCQTALGTNIFIYDNYDMFLIIYDDVLNEILDIITGMKTTLNSFQIGKLNIFRDLIVDTFSEKPENKNCRNMKHRNKQFQSVNFLKFLNNREFQLKKLDEEYNYLMEFLS